MRAVLQGEPGRNAAAAAKAVQEHFDAASGTWADYYQPERDSLWHVDVQARLLAATEMLKTACEEMEGKSRILDVGVGTGEGTSLLAPGRAKVYGVDVSLEMIKKSAQRYPRLRLYAGSALSLPFAAASFDIILSLGTLEYVPGHQQAIAEFRRTLRPGGSLVLSFPNAGSLFRRLHGLERALSAPLRRVRGSIRDEARGHSLASTGFSRQSWTVDEMEDLLGAARFSVIEVRLVTYGWLFPMAEGWPLNVAFCRWMNAHLKGDGRVATQLACTTIVRARAVL